MLHGFRFNAIRQLSATKSEWNGLWAGHHQNDAVTIVRIKRREHIHIESRIRRRGLSKAGDRRGEQEVEQWRHSWNWLVILKRCSGSERLRLIAFIKLQTFHKQLNFKLFHIKCLKNHLWCEQFFFGYRSSQSVCLAFAFNWKLTKTEI